MEVIGPPPLKDREREREREREEIKSEIKKERENREWEIEGGGAGTERGKLIQDIYRAYMTTKVSLSKFLPAQVTKTIQSDIKLKYPIETNIPRNVSLTKNVKKYLLLFCLCACHFLCNLKDMHS